MMRPVDVAAWTDVLGVGQRELPWMLRSRIRVVEDAQDEINRIRLGLRGAPDEELVLFLEAACRSLGAAGHRLEEHLDALQRTAS